MASNTDKFKKGARRFTTTVGAGGVPDASATTIPLTSVTGLPTDTAIEITIDRIDASGNLTLSKEEVVTGVISGSNLTTCVRGVEGTAQAHGAGAVVEVRLTANQWDDVVDGILAEHNQDGTHDTSNLNGYNILTGWQSFTGTMPTYDSTTDGVDLLNMTDDLTSNYQSGDWIKITSGAGIDLIYKVKEITSTTMKVVGETSVSGTITAVSFSKMHSPQGALDWRDLFIATIKHSTDSAISAGLQKLNLDTVGYDPNSNWDTVNFKYTFPVTGKYEINWKIRCKDSNTSIRQVTPQIYIDGTSFETGSITNKDVGNRSSEAGTVFTDGIFNRGQVAEFYFNLGVTTTGGTTLESNLAKAIRASIKFVGI